MREEDIHVQIITESALENLQQIRKDHRTRKERMRWLYAPLRLAISLYDRYFLCDLRTDP